MYTMPLDFLGPVAGKRLLIGGIGVDVVAFAQAGADVYGFDPVVDQVEAIKDLARVMGLRERAHLHSLLGDHLPYPSQFFDLLLVKAIPEDCEAGGLLLELARVTKTGGRAAFKRPAENAAEGLLRRTFGEAIAFEGDAWICVEKSGKEPQSHWSDLNRRPLDYESRALPLSYSGGTSDALARIRTATPFGTTPSR